MMAHKNYLDLIPIPNSNEKTKAVLRVVKGETLRQTCHETGCKPIELAMWVEEFVYGGIKALGNNTKIKNVDVNGMPFSMVDLREHSFRLARLSQTLFQTYSHDYSPHIISDWLLVASSIKSIDFDFAFLGHCVFCSNEYEYERSDILQEFVMELTTFLYNWGGLESIIEIINPPKVPKTLKKGTNEIDRAIYLLQQKPKTEVPLYRHLLNRIEDELSTLSSYVAKYEIPKLPNNEPETFEERIRKRIRKNIQKLTTSFTLEKHMEVNGLGLHTARKIRNTLFHGALIMPEPDEIVFTHLLSLSNRLVLMSIQMLLLASFSDSDLMISKWDFATGSSIENNIPIELALRTLHLKEADESQLLLFDIL
jgi:hypothetical protein